VLPSERIPNFGFAFRKDFPYLTLLGLIVSLALIFYSQGMINDVLQSEDLNFSITDKDGDIVLEFSDLSIWILISLVYAIFLIVFFILPLSLYFRGLTQWEWDPTDVIFWLILTRGFSIFLEELGNTNRGYVDFLEILINIVDSITIIFLTIFLLKAYSNFVVPAVADWLTVGKSDTQYGPLLEILGSLLIIVFGVTNFLSTYHVDFGVLIAGVGVVGLVIALAAQDTLSNFFSGILLLLDQGFKTGDMIKFSDTYCIIREVGLRSTKIYDIINHVIIIIPNNALANQDIVNLTKPDRYYRLRILIGVSYDSDAREVEQALIDVAKDNKDVEQDDPTRLPLVRFQEFADSSLNFALVVWIKNVIKIRQINSDLHHEVFTKLGEKGIVIAFPQRDVHLYKSSKPSGKYTAESTGDSDIEKKAREEAEEKARQAEEDLKKAEESAKQAEEERAKLEVEEAERQVEESAKEAEEAAKKAEEEKSKKAEKEAKRAEEAAKKAEEEKAKLEAEEAARKKAKEKARKEAEKESKKEAREAEREAKKAEKEAKKAEEAAKKVEEEKSKLEAEEAEKKAEEEKAKFEAEEAARLADEKKARIVAEEAAKIAEEKKAKLEVEEAATRKLIEEIKARRAEK
jgi:small-conductance mechanosensitive channel